MEPSGKHVLVMGGGIMGTETALYLARQGKQVTITTRREEEELAQELFDHNNRHMLLRMVKGEDDITVLSKTVPVKLEDGVVKVDQNGAEKKIPVDGVVFAGRMTSQNELYDSLEDTENVTPIGDCVEPGRIMDAVWGGFNTVREI